MYVNVERGKHCVKNRGFFFRGGKGKGKGERERGGEFSKKKKINNNNVSKKRDFCEGYLEMGYGYMGEGWKDLVK